MYVHVDRVKSFAFAKCCASVHLFVYGTSYEVCTPSPLCPGRGGSEGVEANDVLLHLAVQDGQRHAEI